MKCPHCLTGINLEIDWTETWSQKDYADSGLGYRITYGHCSECENLIVSLETGAYLVSSGGGYLGSDHPIETKIIYPTNHVRNVEKEVQNEYRSDFLEASAVLNLSPKASAALSRRLLQHIFREKFGIKKNSLAGEIDEFIKSKDVPSYLAEAVDAVRNIGNFAAHPLKDTNTGEIVEVEPGEAEWLLDVIEALFDFAFVQPARLAENRAKLNNKLKSLGKPPMKSNSQKKP